MPEYSFMTFVCQAAFYFYFLQKKNKKKKHSSGGSASVPKQPLQCFTLPTARKIVLNLAARETQVNHNYYCSLTIEIGKSFFFFFAVIFNLPESYYLLGLFSLD